ncbi:hypothetical protein HZS_6831 [Henneguya salminicola]|uniref:La-related protein 1 (Trinotate prediction) n=1 Tax=Henneguya salminicola TaxID=69463 RepID=A0A6G3MEC6_HENSL|nr:hypothetical protein HZS_6831 [Henneguya salminicola]
MNSNGDHSQNNCGIENQRGNSQNRYRNPVRRGRGRQNQEKGNQIRTYRDKRGGNWRESTSRHPTNETESIDIHDSTQWPSIQESSMGVSRNRTQPPPQSDRSVESLSNKDSMEADSTYEQSGSHRSSSYRGSSNSGQFYSNQQTSQTYGFRDYSRYPSNRARGLRYNGQSRGYSGGYMRRSIRGPFHHNGPSYPPDPMMTGFFNGHFMVAGYPFQYMYDSRPKEIDPMRQVEYYFSAYNLETDYYIRSQMDTDGWVDLNVVFKFKRIQSLEISFEDFVNLIISSELLEIDVEKKKVRTKIEPQKWILDNDTKLAQSALFSTAEVSQAPVYNPSQNYSSGETHAVPYGMTNPNPSYSSFPPVFFSVPGYPNSSARARYSATPQYNMYPNSYYNAPYPEMPSDGGYSYYMPPEYLGFYPSDSQNMGYYNSQSARGDNLNEGYESSSSAFYNKSTLDNEYIERTGSNSSIVQQEKDLEQISKKLSDINITAQDESK